MEFDPDFKVLLSPDKLAETSAAIDGAAIQASAAIKAAGIQASAAIDAANIQWNATLLGSVAVIAAALVAFGSAVWQVGTEKRIHKNKVDAYRRFILYKCDGIYRKISQSKLIMGGMDIPQISKSMDSIEFAFSFLRLEIEDLSPINWEAHSLLGGRGMGLISDLFVAMTELMEEKEHALKKLSALHRKAMEIDEPWEGSVRSQEFWEQLDNARGSILHRLDIVKSKNDSLIKFIDPLVKPSPQDVLWSHQ